MSTEATEDGMVETERHTRLRPYEIQLKKFNYQQVCACILPKCLLDRADLTVVCVCSQRSFCCNGTVNSSVWIVDSIYPIRSTVIQSIEKPAITGSDTTLKITMQTPAYQQ